MKKTGCFLLAVIMLLGTLPLASHAADIVDSGYCGGEGDGKNLTWTLDSDGLLTISGSGKMKNDWSGPPWQNNNALKTVVIQSSVTSIGAFAFSSCVGLTSVTIPDSVTSIENNAFDGCAGLTSVTIPDSVTSIGNSAFSSCSALQHVTLPDSLKTIGDYAFFGCRRLIEISIPADVTHIGKYAYDSCPNLTTITVAAGNPFYNSVGNCLIEAASKKLLLGCQNSVIPADGSVTSIGNSAFIFCEGLKDVTIPDSVTHIGVHAFYECKGLTSVTIPDSVKEIGSGAFKRCTGLTKVVLPENMKEIPAHIFEDCTGLETITIPKCVTSIGEEAFEGCAGLTSIHVAAGNPVYHAAGNCLIETAAKTLVLGCQSSVIPTDGSVTKIGDYAFAGCTKLINITIPDRVTSIGDYAFGYCEGLEEIAIPDSVTSIGRAFYDCGKLTNVILPKGLDRIEGFTFFCCSSLADVAIPGSVTSIGIAAFVGCNSLTAVTIPEGVTTFDDWVFSGCDGLAAILLPASLTQIGNDAIPDHTVIYGDTGSYARQWAEENNRAFIPIGDATVTLNAPELVNESAVNVNGFANPGAEVICSVNGKETVTVQASANCRWSAAIPLTGAQDGDSFTVKATVTQDGKTAEKTVTVTYKPDAVAFRALTLNHSCYSVNINANDPGPGTRNVTYLPGNPLSFKVKVNNNDRIDKLFVVSTKNGAGKKLALSYNAATGLWFAEGFFDESDKNYVPGVLTVTGVDKDGKVFDAGVTIKINFLIDPSGYAYEAVQSNKLEGVTAAVYYLDEKGHELLWNAETADQLNPVATLADGAFAWVVPEGKWQVRLTKDGYETAASEWMDVPPEHTNVYIPMVSQNAPEAAYCNIYADRAEITFTQYMNIDSVNTDNVKFEGYTGKITPLDKTETAAGSGVFYAKAFAFTPEKAFSGDVFVAISGVKNYVDREIASPYTATFTVAAEPKNLTATQDVSVIYGGMAKIEISSENAAGKTVSVSCDSANVTLSDRTVTLDEAGKATLSVTGEMPGTANLTFALDGTALTVAAKVFVTLREKADDTPSHSSGDVDGDGEVTSGDARLALRASVQLEHYEPGSAPFLAADVDKNGVIEASDARTILRVSVMLESF